jgi:hypothetical protein
MKQEMSFNRIPRHFCGTLLLSALLSVPTGVLWAQTDMPAQQPAPGSNQPSIIKIDPPNWWADMPKPMLLIQGQHLEGARFSLSDRALHLERTQVSKNGDWAELWLAADPAKPETITITIQAPSGRVSKPYTPHRARWLRRIFLKGRDVSHHDRPLRRR